MKNRFLHLLFPVLFMATALLPRPLRSQTTAATISGQVTGLALALACFALLLAVLRRQALGLRQVVGIRRLIAVLRSMLHSKTTPLDLRPLTSLRPVAIALSPLLAFLFISPALNAQTTAATISGQVVDSTGALVRGAQVELKSTLRGTSQTATTNQAGIYVFPTVDPGPYSITVRRQGFRQVDLVGLVANVQDHIEQNFKLQVGSVSESVTVEGNGININKSDGSVSTVVDSEMVKNMPLNGRSFQDLILLTPGVVTNSPQNPSAVGQSGEFSVNGQRTESNYYTVDGVSANVGASPVSMLSYGGASGSVPGATALGTTQALVSVDDLQEFRVQSSTYSAEHGRNPGGQFAFETKSGTNRWNGTGYDYLRNDYFDANDWFNDYLGVPEPPLRQNDFGGTLGGPVWIPKTYDGKEKTFFFVSYEGLRLLQPQPAEVNIVPDTALRANTVSPLNQVLNAFPVPNGPPGSDDIANGVAQFIASWSNPSSIDVTSARVDHVFGERLRTFFRFSNASSSSAVRSSGIDTGAPPSLDNLNRSIVRTYTGGANASLTRILSNEFRLNYSSTVTTGQTLIDSLGGSTPVSLTGLVGLGPGSAPFVTLELGPWSIQFYEQKNSGAQRQWNFNDSVSLTSGRHQFKFGADYRRLTPLVTPTSPLIGYYFLDEPSLESNNGYVFPEVLDAAYPLYVNLSLFAQDEWKVSSRLNLSLGLRWELNPPPGVTQRLRPYTIQGTGPDNWSLAPEGTPLWKTAWFNFAPRLGAAYILRNASSWETVVRGGAGVFFDTGQQLGSSSFGGPGFGASGGFLPGDPNATFPGNIVLPQIMNPPQPPFVSVYGFAPHLQLPYTLQWNLSLEQALGKSQAFTVSYVGSHAARLLQSSEFHSSVNQISSDFLIAQNGQTSNYHSFQAQFQRKLSNGLTGLSSYTWSHCLDYGSSNFLFGYQRENCDFDVRHNFSGALSYDLPISGHDRLLSALLGHWGLDDRLSARTAFPVTLNGEPLPQPNGKIYSAGLSFVPGQPVYLYGTDCASAYNIRSSSGQLLGCPGGRAINPNAFLNVTSGYGDAPRNFARGFGAWQLDTSVRRDFAVHENLKLQFRAEGFNLFNHPNFGGVNSNFGQTTFGQATVTLAQSLGTLSPLYQLGGPRSLQFALKIAF